MCGIVGYLGKHDALPVILAGLERLEYRGYDSAGVALFEKGDVKVTRALGKLKELRKLFVHRPEDPSCCVGIGHTRWATHGRPSEDNAHPHSSGRVSLVHNGIIENYVELKEELERAGVSFKSETDTEVAAHLVQSFLKKGDSPFNALKKTCQKIRGSYAFVLLDKEHPDRLLFAKVSSPLVIGLGEDEVILASDIPAALSITKRFIILEDGDIGEASLGNLKIENLQVKTADQKVIREPITVSWDPVTAQKGGYKHFMLKEIHEQGIVLADTYRGRVEISGSSLSLPELHDFNPILKSIKRIQMVACGTAWHACLIAKFLLEKYARIPCEVDYASEFRYRSPVLDKETLVLAISQSGETADTLAAIELAQKTSPTMAICNVLGSTLSRKAQKVFFTHAGPEISVASTKAFTTQVAAAYMLSLHMGSLKNSLPIQDLKAAHQKLTEVPKALEQALQCEAQVEAIAKELNKSKDFLYLGRGLCYPIALEGALKMKELSYIHAEGYPAGEMKHGPIALIDEEMPVVVLLPKNTLLLEKTLSNLKEVETRGGRIIAITDTQNHSELKKVAKHVIEVPFVSDELTPLILSIPLQLLAYYVATINGTDVDLPRNLAKSVTVE